MAAECRIRGMYPKELVQTWQFTSQSRGMVGLNCEMLRAA